MNIKTKSYVELTAVELAEAIQQYVKYKIGETVTTPFKFPEYIMGSLGEESKWRFESK